MIIINFKKKLIIRSNVSMTNKKIIKIILIMKYCNKVKKYSKSIKNLWIKY